MAIKKTATFKRFVLESMIMMERAQAIEESLKGQPADLEMREKLRNNPALKGLDTDGDLIGHYYVNIDKGVIYDLMPKKEVTDDIQPNDQQPYEIEI